MYIPVLFIILSIDVVSFLNSIRSTLLRRFFPAALILDDVKYTSRKTPP